MVTICNILEEWSFDHTEDFFSDIELDDRLDKSILADRIRENCGNLICVYSERMTLKHYSDMFFKRNYKRFRDLTETLFYEYNPIDNYDRTEERTLGRTNHIVDSTNSSTNSSRSAFNDSNLHPVDSSSSASGTDSQTEGSETETIRARGNIGTMSTQEMVERQRRVVLFDIIDEIVGAWEREFCLQIF